MSTYKALVLESFEKPIALKSLPVPQVAPGSALVSPIYSGVQPYIRTVFAGKLYPITLPLTPGTQCIARVDAVGPDAVTTKPGDIVWVDSTITARDNPDEQILLAFFGGTSPAAMKLMEGVWRNGCYAEKTLVPLENSYVLPERLFKSKEEGGLGYNFKDLVNLNHSLVPYGGLEAAGVGAGSTVIVSPATGLFSGGAVLVALAMGAKVIAASRSQEKMESLHTFPGAKERLTTVALSGDAEKDTASLLAASGGEGAHVYLDLLPPAASGNSTPSSFTSCLRALKKGGEAVLMGGVQSDIQFPYGLVLLNNLTVRGQFMYSPEQLKRYIKLIENGNLVLGRKSGFENPSSYSLNDVEDALNAVERSGPGNHVVLAPNGEQ
ncbi:GroES-like protein [Lophiostoma macrostomum CBS 122681]|uniref:GroES-like protein n=1 Tax=Lophiostoma macrostomum CBS 122681 TaxID=1314788 RepID=A0A6A6SYH7_9PLEO|nr:GroES-like protein [Lophiostoma macrostomum CBS 122681]